MEPQTSSNRKMSKKLLSELETMVSEQCNHDTQDIDTLGTVAILRKINQEDAKVSKAIEHCIDDIAKAVELIVNSFKQGGRLIYIGAGSSGRLGILDAVECPPTFSVDSSQVVGLIAGGNGAIFKAVEGAEDDSTLASKDLQAISLCQKDILVGIAASGRTPYVLGALEYAQSVGVKTVGVTSNPGSAITQSADISICTDVGAEVLTGSTRMKSGTAQKLVLNMLTTTSMIKIGKSYQNLMVDVTASNQKLRARAIKIVIQATGCDPIQAEQTLEASEFNTKLAILMVLTDLSANDGRQLLDENQGFLRAALNQFNKSDI